MQQTDRWIEIGNGRDQFHPWIAIDEAGEITVVFLDRRNDPDNYSYDLYMTRSIDGGLTWSENVRISDLSSDPQAGQMRAGLLGEYIGVTSLNGRVNTIWTDTREGDQDAYTARFYPDPIVDAVALPESTEFHPGDELRYILRVTNTTESDVDFLATGYTTTPWGEPFGMGPVDGPLHVILGPNETRELSRSRRLPGHMPAGRYYYTLRLSRADGDVIDESSFGIMVATW